MDGARGDSYAILIQTGPDDFRVAGANLNIRFSSTVAATPMASLAAVEEGRFQNGVWAVACHLAGDDTGTGGDDRASLRLTANPGVLRASLYSYRQKWERGFGQAGTPWAASNGCSTPAPDAVSYW